MLEFSLQCVILSMKLTVLSIVCCRSVVAVTIVIAVVKNCNIVDFAINCVKYENQKARYV